MPFKSKAQKRLFYWASQNPEEAAKKGIKIDKATVREWEKATGKKKLPEKKASNFMYILRHRLMGEIF